MAAFVFPSAPSIGQIVTNPNTGAAYRWAGKWEGMGSAGSLWLPLSGGTVTGALVVDGPVTITGPVNFGP